MLNPAAAIQTTSLSLISKIDPSKQESLKPSILIQNADPNIQRSGNAPMNSVYKSMFRSTNDHHLNVKPINNFERFLSSLTSTTAHNNSNISYHQSNSNVIKPHVSLSAQNLSGH